MAELLEGNRSFLRAIFLCHFTSNPLLDYEALPIEVEQLQHDQQYA